MDIITDKSLIIKLLKEGFPDISAVVDEPMKNHTYFRIGGNADIFISASSEDEIVGAIDIFRKNNYPFTVIGNGSNLLVSDDGVVGAVLAIDKNFSSVKLKDNTIEASAGTLLSRIANFAADNSLGGFEFASGIPGSLGGAVVMNAGAYGGEMKDVVVSTRYLCSDGTICECRGEEHDFGYRKSCFVNGEIILSSVLQLHDGDGETIRTYMRSLAEKRREKQPLEYPSAGSTFKRPEGYFAAKLIDDAGLRGYRVGDACVSEKHCGFVVNLGDATCAQVMQLMADVQRIVKDKFGVELEPEVRLLGNF